MSGAAADIRRAEPLRHNASPNGTHNCLPLHQSFKSGNSPSGVGSAGDARRWVRWILNPSRRSFKLRVLVDRQRPMKNVTLDRATALQLDANGMDSALDAAADCHVLRNDAALD